MIDPETFEELLRAIRGTDDLEALSREAGLVLFRLRQLKNGLAAQPPMVFLQAIASSLRVPIRRVYNAVRFNRAQRIGSKFEVREVFTPKRSSGQYARLEKVIDGIDVVVLVSVEFLRDRWSLDATVEGLPDDVVRIVEVDTATELSAAGAKSGERWLVDFDVLPRARKR